ncbi:MAG: hypothetical protein CVV04_08335 [Firmicutes bacterium HGW-Firmicutes-9]|jgi:predicted nucleic acid-binding Zn ribbon protein|nr:MAG: hypothetical protein CVV04_08335 [Firmicutes bacterium HGW-Firmicutes-9]
MITKLKKALWYTLGLIPLGAYITTMMLFQPLGYYSGVREKVGTIIWILLYLLSILLYIPLGVWSSYCNGRSKGTVNPGWQGYRNQFRTEKKYILIFLGIAALILLATIFYKPL